MPRNSDARTRGGDSTRRAESTGSGVSTRRSLTARRRAARHRARRSMWPTPLRALALALAFVVPVTGLTLIDPATPAQAAVVQWGTQNGTAPNYQATVNGDFLTAGNGVLACSGTALANTSTAGDCNALHAETTTSTSSYNDFFKMINSNTVTGFTNNSSTATLTIPQGATVAKAFLNWSANTGVFGGASVPTCSPNTGNSATSPFAATRPDAAEGYRSQGVQFKVGSGAIQTVAIGGSALVDTATTGTAQYYSAGADVTSLFASTTTGSQLSISAGNIWTAQGAGCYAGWSLQVIYDYGTYIAGNANSLPHRVVYYEGHVREAQQDDPLTVSFDGFSALTTGTRLGYTLFEGDRGITGDYMSYSRDNGGTYTQVPNAAGAQNNIGIGRAAGSVRYTQTQNTTAFTNQSVDVGTATLSNVVAGDSSIKLQIGTSGDSFLLRNAILSVPTGGISVSKTLDGTTGTQYRTGTENTSYTIVVTNTGSVTLQNVTVTDPDNAACTQTLTGTLAPGASRTITCAGAPPTQPTSQSSVTATARVAGNTTITVSDTSSTTVVLSRIALTKSGALASGATGKAGDTVNYTFTASNTGGGTLTGVSITDPLQGLSALTYGSWPGGTAGTLPAGTSVTATATYVLTQADVDRGSVANTASTVGTDADGGPQPTATATANTTVPAAPALTLSKTGSLAAGATGRVGDVTTFSFTLRNSGNQTITNAAITDTMAGLSSLSYGTWPSGTAGTLAPGQQVTATATYTLKQADVDNGSVKNNATAAGRSPSGAAVSSSPASATVTVTPAPALSTTKSGALPSGSTGKAGDVVTYTFRLSNTGNQTLTGVAVADPLSGLSAVTYGTWPSGTAGTLQPGQTVTATATYTVTQNDVDAGSVVNRATGSGKSPAGTTVQSSAPATVTLSQGPAITLAKSGALDAGSTGKAGDTVTWSFTARNTGNVTLKNVAITDNLAGVSALSYGTWASGTTGTLAPGQSVTATATYRLTQADVDNASVTNTASVAGTPPTGNAVSGSATARVDVSAASNIALTKTGSLANGSTGKVGDTVTWSFRITNTGASTLNGVTVADRLTGISALSYTWPGATGVLAPGAVATATATYALTQADVDAGSVVNTATASGTPTNGSAASSTAAATVSVAQSPAVSIAKSGVLAAGSTGVAGDTVNYTFGVRNSGNTTLTNVSVTDPLPGLSAVSYGSWPGATGTLAPGAQVTATASYKLTQNDVDKGSVANTASASGTTPGGSVVRGSSSALVTVTPNPALALTKSSAPTAGGTATKAGDQLTYTFVSRNTGNVTLTGVTISDPHAGLSTITYGTWASGTAGTLAPGQSITAIATYTLTQADVDSGSVVNTASTTGTTPSLGTVSANASSTRPITPAGTLSLAKTGALANGATGVAGDTVNYTFTARNTGTVTLNGVSISDPHAGLSAISYGTWASGTAGTLAPGQSITATATYRLTQADVDAGSVPNSATVAGRTPANAAVSATAGSTVTVTPKPALTVAKAGSLPAGSTGAAGSVVSYTFRLSNTGSVTLTRVAVTDPLPGLSAISYGTWPSGTAGTLAPGQTVVATASYTVTQADVDAGSIANTATGTGTTPSGDTTTGRGASSVPLASAPGLALTKSVAPGAGAGRTAYSGKAGDTLVYTFSGQNTGNVTLTAVGITDPLPGLGTIAYTWPGTAGTLSPGQTVRGTASYTLTQADVDAGSVANRATIRGTTPSGTSSTASASATQALASSPSIALVKSAVMGGTGTVGSRITYRFDVSNTGNVTVSGVQVSDPLPGLSAITYGTWPGPVSGQLAPGQTVRATATYVITQADVDAGAVTNRATATGTPPTGPAVTATGQATVSTAAGSAAIDLVKTEKLSGTATGVAGDRVDFGYTITNTGTLTLTGVALTDQQAGLSPFAFGTWPSGTAGTLAPGQTVSVSASYTLTQADVDAGSISSSARATGVPSRGGQVSDTDTGSVQTQRTASMNLVKTGSVDQGGTGRVGDTVTFAFSMQNTGTVTVSGITFSDPLAGLGALQYSWPATPGRLAPGQTVTATAGYRITQADVDAGSVVNSARASGTDPAGQPLSSTGVASVPTATSAPSIDVSKSQTVANPSGPNGTIVAGDRVTFTYSVTNTGNTTLTGTTLSDPQTGLSSITYDGTNGATTITLAPGQTATASASYRLSQGDIDAGGISSDVTARGTAPSGQVVTDTDSDSTNISANGAMTFTKRAAFSAGQTGAVGDTVNYTFQVRNSGNVTLSLLEITDPLTQAGMTAITFGTWPGEVGKLAPGQRVMANSTYTVAQKDVDAGSIANTATAHAVTPAGAPVSITASATIPTVAQAPQIGLVKSEVFATGGTGRVGDTVLLGFDVTNTGNTTLTGVTLVDGQPGLSAIRFDAWPGGTTGTLGVGQTVHATASYVLTQADVDAGFVSSRADTRGTPSNGGAAVAASDRRTLVVPPAPDYTFTKTSAVGGAKGVGDTITYTFRLQNTGNVTLRFIQVSDPLPGLGMLVYTWPGATGELAPGAVATATSTYTIRQSDVDAGGVVNNAQAVASPPTGDPVTKTAGATSATAAQTPAIGIVKTERLDNGDRGVAGDEVQFGYTITNTGNVTLSGITLNDAQPGLSGFTYGTWPSADTASLAPGQSVTATATYVLTQADVDAGGISSGVTTTGTQVKQGAPSVTVDASDTGSVTTTRDNEVTVAKRATAPGGGTPDAVAVGDVIRYVISTTNTGTTTLTQITLADSLPGLGDVTFGAYPTTQGTLLPGETVDATADYTVRQSDVDAGSVTNTATVRATPPAGSGDPVTDSDSVTVVAATGVPQIRIDKQEALAAGATGVAGDTVRFSYTVTNTGNVTLTGVTVVDGQPRVSAAAFGPWPGGTPGTLAPGRSVTATASYTLTQADVDAGRIGSTATTRGLPPTGARVADTSDGSVEIAQRPSLAVDKVGTIANGASGVVGDRIDYTFEVVNTGNVTLNLLKVEDALKGVGAVRFGEWPGPVGQIEPGESVMATASYTITQGDVDSGAVINQAIAIATPPSGDPVTATDVSVVPLAQTVPSIRLQKTEALTPGAAGVAGDTVAFSYTVTNTGTSTLTGVGVVDDQAGLSAIAYGTWPTGTAGTLAPGQSVTATATYVLTQADVDAGSVASPARTSGTDPQGLVVSDSAQGRVALTAPAGVSLDKNGAYASGGAGAVGDTVTYTFVVANTGQVTVAGVTVTDPLPGLGALSYAWPGAAGSLAPGQTVTATATYTVTQQDVDAGSIANLADVQATPARGDTVRASDANTVPTTSGRPTVGITKTAALAPGAVGKAGDTVQLSYVVTNTGNQTLTGVSLADEQVGATAPVFGAFPSGTVGRLNPGQSVTATTTYVLTQGDVDRHGISSIATTTGTGPGGTTVQASATAGVSIAEVRDMSFSKRGALSAGSTGQAGQGLDYTFQVRNTGNVTLSLLDIDDQLPGLSDVTFDRWPGQIGVLAPGERVMGRASYTIKQADVDAGSVQNTATASAVSPDGTVVERTATTAVATAAQGPRIGIVKEADLAAGSTGRAGDTVEYSFVVTNSGNVTLTGITLGDDQTALSDIRFGAWPGQTGQLAPGQTVSATATHVLTQADVDRGFVISTATTTGTSPAPVQTVQASDEKTVVIVPQSSLTFDKSVTPTSGVKVGDTLAYTFSMTNTGSTTLSGVVFDDQLVGLSPVTVATWPSGTAGVVSPGQTVVGTATYTVTQNDADSGSIVNAASVTASPPTGAPLSRTDTATVQAAPTQAAIGIVKTAVLATGATGVAGDTVNFSYLITNTGTSTLTGVTVTDAQTGVSGLAFGPWPSPVNRLTPGQSVTASATYVLTQADVDAGFQSSPARTTATSADGSSVSDDASDTVELRRVAAATFDKAAAYVDGAAGRLGDTVRYTFVVANTGTVTLTGVGVTDPLPGLGDIVFGAWPATTGVLEPGQRVSATADYTVTQGDVDSGSIVNTARLDASGPAGSGDPVVRTDSASLATAQTAPAITLAKSEQLAAGATGVAGDTVVLRYTVTNTGDTTLTGVTVSDDQARVGAMTYGDWPGTAGTLAPGQSVTAQTTYVLTQTDVDRGSVTSRGSVVGTPPTGTAVTASDVQGVTLSASSTLALEKTGALAPGDTGARGDQILFGFTVTNTGSVTLSNVAIADRLNGVSAVQFGTWPGAEGVLAPGQIVTATATYTITQADVDRTRVTNQATASATNPFGASITGDAQTTVQTIASGPRIGIVKTIALAPGATGVAGDTVDYTFDVTNTGNVSLTGIGVTDAQQGLGPVTPGTGVTLAPGETQRFTATYTLTQADVDAGRLSSTATTTGTAPDGRSVQADDARALVIAAAPALRLDKSARYAAGDTGAVGDTVEYTFVLSNTGTVTLTDVAVADPLPGLSTIAYAGGRTLAPNSTVVATATYVLTQADVDAGSVVNTASASGTPPTGAPASASASASIATATTVPAIGVTKTQVLADGARGVAGDTVAYTFTVTNTGDSTLRGVTVADAQAGLGPVVFGPWPGPVGELAPGQSVTATASYTLTQGDVDAAAAGTPLQSVVTATGTSPAGADVSATASGSTPLAATAALVVTKSGAVADGRAGTAGDTVTWSFSLRNTGDVTLTGVALTDTLPGLSAIAYGVWPTADGRLAPGETVAATATSTITQADVDAGSVMNTATANGTDPRGGAVTDDAQATVRTAPATPAIAVEKSQQLVPGASGKAGDVVTFRYVVRNTGSVTLRNVTLIDQQPGISAITFGAWPGETGVLEPGQSVTATATYVLTQSDVDNGIVSSPVTAVGQSPSGGSVDAVDTAAVVLPDSGSIALTKTGEIVAPGTGAAGDTVRFTFGVVNTGDVTLSGVAIADELPGLSALTYGTWPAGEGVLAPGARVTASADYTLTQADVDTGYVTNTATVTGRTPAGELRGDAASTTVTVVPRASVEITKTVAYAPGTNGRVGDRLDYGFIVVNTGTVTLTGVRVEDALPGLSAVTYGAWPTEPGVLAPGQRVTASATYTVTAADVAAGKVTNTATAIAVGSDPAPVQPVRDDHTVTITTHVPTLAFTGSDAGSPALAGLLLLVFGFGLALTGRGRARKREH
ncbi:beta strand repeat-containing protein [Frigoribacterium sp. 2-23]|uniref:beta strand repeat-containing protein n=1 Tax=Frigoribacterium sp. 2-23 TaxID=3415006 RepID=UPI003C6FA1A0